MLDPEALRMAYSAWDEYTIPRPMKASTRTKRKLIRNNKQLLWHWTPNPQLPSELHGMAYDDDSAQLIKAVINHMGELTLYAKDTSTSTNPHWRISTLEEWHVR